MEESGLFLPEKLTKMNGENSMMPEQNTFNLNMSQEERLQKLATMGDEKTDYSEIPDLPEASMYTMCYIELHTAYIMLYPW